MSLLRGSIATAACLIVGLIVPGLALALPGPIELVSKSATEQADMAAAPVISQDGRFIAFEGTIGGLEGIFRKNLGSGEINPVAVQSAYRGEPYSGPAAATGAESPSISADGRYVSFTSLSALTPGDEAGSADEDQDVYVADMATGTPRYELASALDGTEEGIVYSEGGGASVAAKASISADGREVVFTIRGASNLLGEKEGTPGGQVVLRDLRTDRTVLVSTEREPLTGSMSDRPVEGGAVAESLATGASLSADGSTVAWLGQNVGRQAPTLADEAGRSTAAYNEPLWRRVADGSAAPTRRMIGGGDPLAPGCPAGGSIADPACQGPFPDLPPPVSGNCEPHGWDGHESVRYATLPQLSADGREVALLGDPGLISNVYLVDMEPGLDRRQAVTELTHDAPLAENACSLATRTEYIPRDGFITDLSISPSGNRVAFTTARQQFPSSALSLLTAPPAGVGGPELYLADLGAGTLQRLTPGNLGEVSRVTGFEGGADSPSFGDEGQKLSFASTAPNLVSGDANGKSDAFVISVPEVAGSPGQTRIGVAPPPPVAKPTWSLSAVAVSLPDGNVRIRAVIPAAGRVRGSARALVGPHLHGRRVATGRRRGDRPGILRLELRIAPRFRRLAHTKTGLAAVVTLGFHAAGRPDLSAVLPVHFRAHAKHRRRARR
jgi:Tol biopolymer transport system component